MANFTTAGVILFILIGVALFHPAAATNDLNKGAALTKPCEEDIENGVGCEKRPDVLKNLDEVDELKQVIKDLKFSEHSERKKEFTAYLRGQGRSHKEGEQKALKVKEKEASKVTWNIPMERGPSSHLPKPSALGARPKDPSKGKLNIATEGGPSPRLPKPSASGAKPKVVTKVDPSFISRALSAFDEKENQAFLAYLEGPKEGRSSKEEKKSFRQKLEALKDETDEFVKVYWDPTTEGERASIVQTMDASKEKEKMAPDAKALAYKEGKPSFIIQGLDALNEEEKEALIAFLKSTREARPTALLQKLRALRGKKREKDAYIAFLKGTGEGGSSPLLQKLRPLDEEENELFIAFLRGTKEGKSSFEPKLNGLKLRKADVFFGARAIHAKDKDGASILVLTKNGLSLEEQEAFEVETRDREEGALSLLEELKALPGKEKGALIELLNGNGEVRPSSVLRKLRALRGQDREAAIARWVSAAKSGPPSHRRDPSASGGKPRDASEKRLNIVMGGGPSARLQALVELWEKDLDARIAHVRGLKEGLLLELIILDKEERVTFIAYLEGIGEEKSTAFLWMLSAIWDKRREAFQYHLKGFKEGNIPVLQQAIESLGEKEKDALQNSTRDEREGGPSLILGMLNALDEKVKGPFLEFLKDIKEGRASSFLRTLSELGEKDKEEFIADWKPVPGLPQKQGVPQVRLTQPHGAAEGGEEIRSPPGSPQPTQQQATTKKKKNKKKK